MRATHGFIDSRDGLLCVMVHGQMLCYETVPALALAVHSYGFHFIVEPPDDEDWRDYVARDARFYMQVNEELHQIREDIRLRHPGWLPE